jgi:hypothetical protein
MSSPWHCLEKIHGLAAVTAEWERALGANHAGFKEAFLTKAPDRAAVFPCSQECGCVHRVIAHGNGKYAGVCQCGEDGGCADLKLTENDVAVWQLNWTAFGRAIAKALGCEPQDADLSLSETRQIASFGNAALPVVLTIQPDAAEFDSVIRQLVGQLGERFIVLAPTSRFCNANSQGLLKKGKAGFFDLATNLILTPGGQLQSRRRGGEMFTPFLPEQEEAVTEAEAVRVFALMKSLDSGLKVRKAPLGRVFHLLVLEGRLKAEVARQCNCTASLITLRVAEIEKRMKRSVSELQSFATRLGEMNSDVSDSPVRSIYKRGLTDDTKKRGDR